MKKLLPILILIFTLQTPSWADDIRDFQIEGMSIGDSLLDYFSEKDIKSSVFKTTYKSKKYTKVEFYDRTKLYDGLQFYFKKNDKKYIIHVLSAHLKYEYNIEDCFKKQDEIIEEVLALFKNTKNYRKTLTHKADKSGKSKVYAFFLDFSSGDSGRIDCNDYSKKIEKKYGWEDNLRIALVSSEFRKWLRTEGFK